jgi:hypothetical protein
MFYLSVRSAQVLNLCWKGKISVQMWEFLFEYLQILLEFTKVDDDDYAEIVGDMCNLLYQKSLVMMANKFINLKVEESLMSWWQTHFGDDRTTHVIIPEILSEIYSQDVTTETEKKKVSIMLEKPLTERMVDDFQLQALTRLLAMSMARSNVDTCIIASAYKNLAYDDRKVLLDEMTKKGISDGYAIQLSHAPKMLQNLMDLHKDPDDLARQKAQNFNFGMESVKMELSSAQMDVAIECMEQGLSILAKAYKGSRDLLQKFQYDVKYNMSAAGALSKNQSGVFNVDCYALSLCPPSKLNNRKISIRIKWAVNDTQLKTLSVPPSAACSILHKW